MLLTQQAEKERQEKEAAKLLDKQRAYERRYKRVASCCCYKGYRADIRDPDELAPIRQVCCWRFYKSRMSSYKYVATEDPLNAVESV